MSRVTKGIPEWQTGIADLLDYVDGEYNHIISVLNMYQEEPSMWESYDKYTWSEAVRMPQHEYHNDKDIFRSARAERALRSKPKGKK